MAVGSFGIFSILFALLSGGANDLLDFVSSDAYWKAKAVTVSMEQLTAELKTEAGGGVAGMIKGVGGGGEAQRGRGGGKNNPPGPAGGAGLGEGARQAPGG